MSISFWDCMKISNGRHTCRASDLYTKKDPFRKTPQSFSSLSFEEKENTKNHVNDPKNPDRKLSCE